MTRKKSSKNVNIGIIVIVMVLSVLILGTLVGGGKTEGTFLEKILPEPKNQVECDVTLERAWWGVGGVQIKTANCRVIDTCYLSFVMSPLVTVFAEEGEVRLYMDSTLDDHKSYEIGVRQTKTYKLTACTDKKTARIQTIDEQGAIIQTETRMVS